MYETYLQNEREFDEEFPLSFFHSGLIDSLEIKSHNRLSLIKVMKALEKELEKTQIDYIWENGECSECGFIWTDDVPHKCNLLNKGLQLSLDKIREFISKLEENERKNTCSYYKAKETK